MTLTAWREFRTRSGATRTMSTLEAKSARSQSMFNASVDEGWSELGERRVARETKALSAAHWKTAGHFAVRIATMRQVAMSSDGPSSASPGDRDNRRIQTHKEDYRRRKGEYNIS
jgi:hypothetical protein